MKLLFENWRKYLAERQTDQVYSDLVDFFVDLYTTPSNFEWESEEEQKEYGEWWDPEEMMKFFEDDEELAKKTKGLLGVDEGVTEGEEPNEEAPEPDEGDPYLTHQYFLVEPRIREAWSKLKEIPGGPELLGLETEDDFAYKIHESTTLEIAYGLINFEMISAAKYRGHDDPKQSKRLLGIYADGMLGINLMGESFNMSEDEFRALDEYGVLAYVGDKKGAVREVVEHELTHMINHFRAGTLKRAKGIARQHRQKDPKTQSNIRYANSTEEIQARLIPIFKLVKNTLSADWSELSDLPSGPLNAAALIRYEIENFAGNESLSKIVKLLFYIYEQEHPGWVKLLNKKNYQRIMHRFYEFAEELPKDRELPADAWKPASAE
jgi:hypothetical protein